MPVSCNRDCGAGCPLLAHVNDGRLLKITNNPNRDPYMTGCVRGFKMPDVVYHPERIRRPLLRTGERGSGHFKAISWDNALDAVAQKLTGIKETFGSESILRLGGSGSCRGAVHNTAGLTMRFLSLLGGFTATSSSYSSAAVSFITPFVPVLMPA